MNVEQSKRQDHELFARVAAEVRLVKVAFILFVAAVMFFSGVGAAYANDKGQGVAIHVLSSRPDVVSGGNALVQVSLPEHMLASDVRMMLNDKDVTGDFHLQADRTLAGLAEGMALGKNHLAVFTKQDHGRPAAELEITNHPITGPIFSGPHQAPFVCETATFMLPVTGGALGPSLDADCSIATRVDYVYKSTDGSFKLLPNSAARPADLVQTTTNEGHTVSYIVRIETGTINRAIYQIAMLQDSASDPAPNPWTRLAGWNGRLVYSFGGGCAPGYHQGSGTGGVLNDLWLSQGYAAASSSLNVFGNNCNDVLSAETMGMVKEHFVKQYGVPRYTIGWGRSGGSMQQHLLAQNYPGLLDGITPGLSFPDAITMFTPITDCPLLARVFDSSTQSWTTEQKTAVSGWGTWDFCMQHISSDWNALVRAGLSPGSKYTGCSAAIPPALIYDPSTNPTGARCTWFDNLVNIFGRDSKTGFAGRAIDNVGVQYGLKAFNSGQISAAQFLELNERIGGYDVDGNMVANRTVADPGALRIAYESGRVDSGAGGLGSIPIIDYRDYRDLVADPHDSVRSHIMRARLIAANGSAANQVILVGPPSTSTPDGAKVTASISADVLRLMDQWLGNIARDTSTHNSIAEKVVRNKPAELVDACYGSKGEKITDAATCKSLYPVHSNSRLVAGQPLTDDILKCQLKPPDPKDYIQSMTSDQMRRLKAIFSRGVCDYGRPSVGQERLQGIWFAYPRTGKLEPTLESQLTKDRKN